MKTKLYQLEKQHNIKIVHACESGSRAWGMASPDSDYDVRYIYTKPIEWYLSISEKKDTISILEGDFDAVGWDLRKTLRLLKKSNVAVLEHLYSPITYLSSPNFIKEIEPIAIACFSPIAAMYHYLNMSKNYTSAIIENTKLKSIFYAIRTTLAGQWILEKKTMPPVLMSQMFELVPISIRKQIQDLLAIKSVQNESYTHDIPKELIKWILLTIENNELHAKSLPSGKPDLERIDQFLYKQIML